VSSRGVQRVKFLPLIFRNLGRNRRRTLLTIVSIAVSIFIFAALMSLPAVVNEILRDRISALRVICHNKAGFTYPLPQAYGRTIAGIPHVEAVTGYAVLLTTYRDPSDRVGVAGVDPDAIREMWPDWGITAAEAEEFEQARTKALVSADLMKRFKWKLGDHVTLRSLVPPADVDFTIGGVFGSRGPDNAVFLPLDRIQRVQGSQGKVVLFWLRVDRSSSIPQVIREIDERFANSANQTETESESALARNQLRTYRLVFVGAKAIAAIVLFAIALVAANTAAMAVRERRHELAVLRAIGFTRRAVVVMVLGEGVLIGLGSGLFGCAIAYAALKSLPHFANALGPIAQIVRLMPGVAAASVALATAIGLLSAAIPGLTVTRRRISDEIRAVI
jgi:putative ABC transport system permease protein